MAKTIKKSKTDIENFFDAEYVKEQDFKLNRFLDGEDTAKNNLVIMESHTDPWIDHYVEQQLECKVHYFHKRTMYFTLLGNFDTARNKKDMNYDSNTCNHMWCHDKTKTELESIIKNIAGKTIYAVWDFDYLLKVCLENHSKYYTKFVTFMHANSKINYLKQLKRDEDKIKFCNLNEIVLLEYFDGENTLEDLDKMLDF